MSFSYATVETTTLLSPRIRRIGLRIDDPEALAVQAAGDSAVGVYFPVIGPDGRRTAPGCVTGPDGKRYVDEESGSEGRNYSVRRQDGQLIELDVVLHERGVATTWANTTGPGDRVGLDHARSWYRPAADTAWQLLVADLSGLPAAARIVEQLPGGQPVTVIAEVADTADLEYLPQHPDVTVISSVGTGNGHAPSQLARLAANVTLPEGRGYCWFAGEAAQSRAVRKHFRGLGWTIEQLDVTGYWRFDSETWDAKYVAVADEVEAIWVKAMADGRGERVADELYDAALERAGL